MKRSLHNLVKVIFSLESTQNSLFGHTQHVFEESSDCLLTYL